MAKRIVKGVVSAEAVAAGKAALSQLATKAPPRISRREMVIEMRQEIESALKKGYTLEDIMQILIQTHSDLGGLSLTTLRTYLQSDRTAEKKRTIRANTGKESKTAKKPAAASTKASSLPASTAATEMPSQQSREPKERTSAGLTDDV